MFANLKNKLIEEVKASPSKFQQFANAAQAAVSSSTSTTPSGSESTTTTNENFFSITEEDTPQNSPYKPLKLPTRVANSTASPKLANNGISTGAIPRTRRLSNSSMASDISFRLPAYDASSAAHLQSDLDISASEVEDSASSMKLETITKEHLYNAYKNSLDRYHKYRCSYTDLAKKYKDLERDSTKARSVLVETQEKAIRRISELREQCALEQQAKAHLEEALRMEMDDMQCKMQAYQTKLKLLGESPEQIAAALATGEAMANEKKINEVTASSDGKFGITVADGEQANGETATRLQQQLDECEIKLQEIAQKYEESTATIDLLRKKEEENILSLAQTKQAIYSELESKDREVKTLQDAVKRLQNELQNATKDKPFSSQAKKEMDAKIIANEHLISELREKCSMQEGALSAAEDNLKSLRTESEQKLADIRQQNSQLNEMIERYQRNEVSLAEIDNELNRTKTENDSLKATLEKTQRRLSEIEREANEYRASYEQRLKTDRLQSEEKLREAECKIQNYDIQIENLHTDQESLQLKVKQLQTELQKSNEERANTESEIVTSLRQELKTMQDELSTKENELKDCLTKLREQSKQHDSQQAIITQQTEEIEKLKKELGEHAEHLQSMQLQAKEHEQEADREKEALKEKVASILNEIAEMEQQMCKVQQSHLELENEKRSLEEKIENMRVKSHGSDQGQEEEMHALIEKLTHVEGKLHNVACENSQLAEKNCLLAENATRMEKLLAETDRERSVDDEASVSEMRMKLEEAQNTIQKLNDKLTQVLDENSRMHNTKELLDHDCRTLQDKCDALEKEKLLIADTQRVLEEQNQQLEKELSEILESNRNRIEMEQNKASDDHSVSQRYEEQQKTLETEIETLNKQLKELQDSQTAEERKLREELQKQQLLVVDLEANVHTLQAKQKELIVVEEKVRRSAEDLDAINDEVLLLRENNEMLNTELKQRADDFEGQEEMLQVVQTELFSVQQELQRLTADLENKNEEIKALQLEQHDVQALKQLLQQKQEYIDDLEGRMQQFASSQSEFATLQEKFLSILEDVEHKNEELLLLRENNLHLNDELQLSKQDVKQKAVLIEKMQKEHEIKQNKEVAELNKTVTELNEALTLRNQQLKSMKTTANELQNTLANNNAVREVNMNKIKELESLLVVNADKLANSEQLQIENEYLNKNVQQLEANLEQQKQSSKSINCEANDLKAFLQSLQSELYILRENLQKQSSELEQKQRELEETHRQLSEHKQKSELDQDELNRQTEHIKYIIDENDKIQQELLKAQQQIGTLERSHEEMSEELKSTKTELQQLEGSTKSKEDEVMRLNGEILRNQETIESLQSEVKRIANELQANERLGIELSALKVELGDGNTSNSSDSVKSAQTDSAHLRKLNAILQNELEDLKHKSKAEISNLQQEIEELQSTTSQMSEKLCEYEVIIAAVKQKEDEISTERVASNISHDRIPTLATESNDDSDHEAKLKNIMQEVQDVSNRNLFLEQKCENYLILEQSNERLKLQNAKLSRQLDETLVSLQHNEGITANTEFEYLKNIMFQYLTGSDAGNNETLVKVISAVLRFSPQQTQVAIEKEHQRRSLINKIL